MWLIPMNTRDKQTPSLQCFSDKLDDAFLGNTSQFVSDCELATMIEVEADLSEQLQAVVPVAHHSVF
jgi:hypothetical protein